MRKRSRLLLPVLVLILGMALIACDGGGEDSAAENQTVKSAEVGAQGHGAEDGLGEGGGDNGSGVHGDDTRRSRSDGSVSDQRPDSLAVDIESIPRARLTETGAVQTLTPNPAAQETAQKHTFPSIRSFGREVEGEEATNITLALVQYLTAKAQGDWATACARIYSVLRKNLEPEGRSCPQTFGALMGRSARAIRAEQARIDVSSVRRGEGNRAFVIYKTPQTLSVDMPMYVEDGIWKVGALDAYALRPEQVG